MLKYIRGVYEVWRKRSEYEWELEQKGKMNVPGRIFASKQLLNGVMNNGNAI